MTTPLSGEGLPASLTDGLWLRGQFLSGKVQKGRPNPEGGNWPDRYIVTLLTGDRTVQIEYGNEEAARAALGPALGVPTEEVVVPVGVRAAKGYVFYFGRRS